MSSYHFDPNDWNEALPNRVRFYDFGGGVYQAPMWDTVGGTYLTASLVALCELPKPGDVLMKIVAFKIPHMLYVQQNSDWGPIVEKMVEHWKKGDVAKTPHGGAIPIVDL